MRRDARHPVGMRLLERLLPAADHYDIAGLDLHAGARCGSVELARRDRVADRDVALLPPRGHVEEDAARGDAVEERIDRAPGGAGRAQALHERPPIVELAVERHVAERVDVGDGEAVVDKIEAVEDHVGALAVARERGVVHERGLGPDVARQRHGAAGTNERLRGGAPGRGDQVHGAALVVAAPAPPVVQLLEVALDARRRRQPAHDDPRISVNTRDAVRSDSRMIGTPT